MSLRSRSLVSCAAFALAVAFAQEVRADVTFEGAWDLSKNVTLDLQGVTRGEALRALAKEAGLSVVAPDLGADKLDLHIEDQPADKVLGVLLSDGAWVAKREGTLVTIKPAPTLNPADQPPESRPKPKKDRDVEVLGDRMRIGKDEVVHNVTVLGGSVIIEGRITGDLAVLGGSAEVLETGLVEGNVSVTGGRIALSSGAQIEGDLTVLGGGVDGLDQARVDGSVKLDPSEGQNQANFATRAGHRISESLRNGAMLFIIGAIFVALFGERAELVRSSIAAKPMRSIALGIVGLLGACLALGLVAVTVIGIPVAVIGAVFGIFLLLSATTSALTVIGASLYGHKSSNVYVQLAVGTSAFILVGLIPKLGGLAQVACVFAGIGGLVSTRCMGLIPKRIRDAHPFRSVASG